jgi:hypothetical protein
MTKKKIFCIGFHKTGTTSISEALEFLGYKTIHGDPRKADHVGDEGRTLLENHILKGDYNLPTFDLYDAFTDNPYFSIWDEIIKIYPDAKYILTVRDDEKWIKSCVNYYQGRRVRPMREWMFGENSDLSKNNESRMTWLNKYKAHNQRVIDHFAKLGKELLIFDIEKGHGWKELCEFLNISQPSIKFPHRNKNNIRKKIIFTSLNYLNMRIMIIKIISIKILQALKNIICNLHPLFIDVDPKISKKFVFSRMAFSKGGNYCYFRIPKCANSTISKTLAYYDPSISYNSHDIEVDQKGQLAKKSFSSLFSAYVLSTSALKKNFFLFSFFRNPYSRLLSAYFDKLAKNFNLDINKSYNPKIKTQYIKAGGKLSFDGFVTYLEEGGLYVDPHWAPQVSLLPVKPSELSFLGKVETLDKDLSKLTDLLFGKGVFNKVITRQTRRTFADNFLSHYYTDDLEKRVYKIYQKDFDLLSYEKDIKK